MYEAIVEIIRHINADDVQMAIEKWSALRKQRGGCDPCFLEKLPDQTRCANCLEAKLRTLSITRSMLEIPENDLHEAMQSLNNWIKANDPPEQPHP